MDDRERQGASSQSEDRAVDAPGGIPRADGYRGWSVAWDYGYYTATGPNYDASWEGPEDGWVDNGHRVSALTLPDLCAEVDAFLEEAGT